MSNRTKKKIKESRRREERAQHDHDKIADALDFNKVFSVKNMYESAKKCKENVSWKQSVINFDKNRTNSIILLRNSIIEGKYKPRLQRKFQLNERGKVRTISPVSYKDRIAQRTACDMSLVPILSRSLIHDNAASLPGKGTDFSRKRLDKHLEYTMAHYEDPYALIFDYHDYFGSIDSHRCYQMIAEKYRSLCVTDKETESVNKMLEIIRLFIEEEPHLGLGNQTSQTAAIWYPNAIDHKLSSLGKYGRYMDDGYCLCKDKETAFKALEILTTMSEDLGLTLNLKKTRVVRMRTGKISFLKRVYEWDKEKKTWIIRMSSKALRTHRRHDLAVIRKYDSTDVFGLRTLVNLMYSFYSLTDGLTDAKELRRKYKKWLQDTVKKELGINLDFNKGKAPKRSAKNVSKIRRRYSRTSKTKDLHDVTSQDVREIFKDEDFSN